jgi:hypothetical protein
MSFKQQLRDWLGGLWQDFWRVPLRSVLAALGMVLWAIGALVWRTEAAFNPSVRASYHSLFPFYALLALLILYYGFPRKIY